LLLDLVACIFLFFLLLSQELENALALSFILHCLQKPLVRLDIFASNRAFHGVSPWAIAFLTLFLHLR